jgi:hypothetical protein
MAVSMLCCFLGYKWVDITREFTAIPKYWNFFAFFFSTKDQTNLILRLFPIVFRQIPFFSLL